ncbi:MAG: hypothetical protein WCT24_00110 [Patescibacteria group bacterium]
MKYELPVILAVFLLLGAGCTERGVSITEEFFGETAYEQNLDAFLAEYENRDVKVLIRLENNATALQVRSLMDNENSPEIMEVTPVSSDGVISGGNVPFSGEMTDDSLNQAIGDYATRLGGEVKKQIEDRISSGDTFLIVSFRATGKADAIRQWWHANSDLISAIVVDEGFEE